MTSIDNLAEEIMQGLQEYADLADTAMKKAVRKSATQSTGTPFGKGTRQAWRRSGIWETAYCSCGRKRCTVAGAFD